jgi:hypothetical protein
MTDKFDSVRFLIEVRRRLKDDALFTAHRPATPGDKKRVAEWPSGGLVQVAHAFIIEYLRREAYVMAITMISQGKKPEDITAGDLEERVRVQVSKMAEKFVGGAVEEAMERLEGFEDPATVTEETGE